MPFVNSTPETRDSVIVPSAKPARRAKAKKRSQNYQSRSTPATVRKQQEILRWVRVADEGFTITEIAALLGISRQLCLYHVKKMAAISQLVMVLEPCDGNGGLQYKVWDHTQLVVNYIPTMRLAA